MNAIDRNRMPNRRECTSQWVRFGDHRVLVGFGWTREANAVREVFADPERAKTGSDFDLMLDDAMTLISVALQRGEDPRDLWRRLGRNGGYPGAKAALAQGEPVTPPATLIGAIADAVAAFQAELDGRSV